MNRLLPPIGFCLCSILLTSVVAFAEIPPLLNHQGRLLDSSGQPVTGQLTITFSIWDDPAAGLEFWSETQDVQLEGGQFNVGLGGVSPIDPSSFSSDQLDNLFLQMQVAGEAPFSPRIPLASVPFSFFSKRIVGDVETSQGFLKIRDSESDPVDVILQASGNDAGIAIGEEGVQRVAIVVTPSSSSMFLVDSFFDITYRIDLEAATEGGHLSVSNIGSSGEDGVSIDVVDTGSLLSLSRPDAAGNPAARVMIGVDDNSATCGIEHEDIGGSVAAVTSSAAGAAANLVVSNIGSSGQDGVTIGVDDNAATCGIEHEDIGGVVSSANSSADAGSSRHEVAHNLSQYQFSTAGLKADGSGAGVRAVDSFFDITYMIDIHASDSGAVSRKSALDDINIVKAEDKTTPNLYQQLCTGQFPDGATHIGTTLRNHGAMTEYNWIPQVGDEVLVGMKADSGGASTFMVDSFFDIEYRIDMAANDSGAASTLSSNGQGAVTKKVDKATPLLAKALCSNELLDESHIAEIMADASGGRFYAADTYVQDIDDVILNSQELAFTRYRPGRSPMRPAVFGPQTAYIVDSFFDITYRVDTGVSDQGALFKLAAIGSSGEDGITMLSSDGMSSISIKEGGINSRVHLSSDGSTDRLSLGDLDADGRLDLVAGSGVGDLGVFFKGPLAEDIVNVSAGNGAGGRISLGTLPVGETIPIEIVALSLVSAEPLVVIRERDAAPTDGPVMDLDFDIRNMLVQTMRAPGSAPGDSSKVGADGFHIFEGNSELKFDLSGISFSDLTGPVFYVTPSGELSAPSTTTLAYDDPVTSMVGIGTQAPTEKLFVDGNICATGFIGPCSDARYKKNVDLIDGALEVICKLQGVRFDWRTDEFPDKHFSDREQVGLIAQEVKKVVPEVVNQGTDGFYSVDYSRLAPILIEAVKEQQKTIESLQRKLEENQSLRAELEDLKSLVQKLAAGQNEADAPTIESAAIKPDCAETAVADVISPAWNK